MKVKCEFTKEQEIREGHRRTNRSRGRNVLLAKGGESDGNMAGQSPPKPPLEGYDKKGSEGLPGTAEERGEGQYLTTPCGAYLAVAVASITYNVVLTKSNVKQRR